MFKKLLLRGLCLIPNVGGPISGSLNSDRRRFVTMWRYNFDDAFHGAVKAYTKHQKLLDF